MTTTRWFATFAVGSVMLGFSGLAAAVGAAVLVGGAALQTSFGPTHTGCDVDLPVGAPDVSATERCDLLGCTAEVTVWGDGWSTRLLFGEDTLCGDLSLRWSGSELEVSKPGKGYIVPVVRDL